MKFESQFDEFLKKTVNLSAGRISKLEERTKVIEGVLRKSINGDLVVVHARPQGSFAQKTIINPKDAVRGFDADLLVEFEDRGLGPAELLGAVKETLKASQHHANLVRRRTRCVELDYTGEFHLDVVPGVRDDYGVPYIANRQTDDWEPTDPDGLTAWMEDHDTRANGHLVPAIRLCKFLRDHKGRPKVKSVVLTLLLAQQVDSRMTTDFPDLPTTLVVLLEDLAESAALYSTPPRLVEPTCGAELRIEDMDWSAFARQVKSLAERARAALAETSEQKSLALWRKLFGKRFPAPPQRVAKANLAAGEMDLLRDFGIPTLIESETVVVTSNVRPTSSSPGGSLSSFGRLPKSRQLKFAIARTSVVPPFAVYWKVKNVGEEARRLGQLRGEITLDNNGASAYREEHTAYTGDHWVEIYIVKDGICVATDRVDVPIA